MNKRFLLFILLLSTTLFSKQPINLKSVYHHIGAYQSSPHLELGTVVLFFSNATIPTVLDKKRSTSLHQFTFLFPSVMQSERAESLIDRANQTHGDGYTMHLSQTLKPKPGLLLTVEYDPTIATFEYESIVSSQTAPGYLFRFINKKVHDALIKQTDLDRVTMVADNTKATRIIIDPGHGGSDPGAQAHALVEKDITLLLGKRIAATLRSAGYDVLLTRSTDRTVFLDERTLRSNQVGADLFVSIHANSAESAHAYGIETFFYPHGKSKQLFCATPHTSSIAQYLKNKEKHSALLAAAIQTQLCAQVASAHTHSAINRSVKQAPLQVLVGTIAPSVLVEVGFMSNLNESGLLKSIAYQKKIVTGVCNGVIHYLKQSDSNA
jgi:N-acetylmuramoyl-L-alanine amidase